MAKPGSSIGLAAGSFPPVSGAAFLASVPHTGNKQLVTRFLFRDPIFAIKLTWWVCAYVSYGFTLLRRSAGSQHGCPRMCVLPRVWG